eukprot:1719-Pelagococcus_subviridis.AAC.4
MTASSARELTAGSRGLPRNVPHAYVTASNVVTASARWSNCTAAVFSKKFRHPYFSHMSKYSSGTTLPPMSGNVLNALPASIPATYAPDSAVVAMSPARGTIHRDPSRPGVARHPRHRPSRVILDRAPRERYAERRPEHSDVDRERAGEVRRESVRRHARDLVSLRRLVAEGRGSIQSDVGVDFIGVRWS